METPTYSFTWTEWNVNYHNLIKHGDKYLRFTWTEWNVNQKQTFEDLIKETAFYLNWVECKYLLKLIYVIGMLDVLLELSGM